MAEEVKVSKFGLMRKKAVRFFKEVRNELKKVIWPSRTQLINNTVTVLTCCLIVGLMIWIVDFGLTLAVDTFLTGK
ncbi:protein translocase subunit secE/sec61 gamma [Anaerobacterium chartisolvens]|uniref:Protein translocase subunit SecE n=1 Tax=Anaerobacterium chartisolvens TaxID=1297424 RepID=A0A369BHU3_9FIRM|nr:preprotein translocase subunit SecE [Anaerobacterium chartisolvens]RCX20835.1 protein translocase subunit secE/sec61 gamma [Anaerobacterium chartisolvens]